MDHKFYKYCIVPQCKSSTIKTPTKLFVHVPRKEQMRKKWLELARRDMNVASDSKMYFCEDHFDLPNDMENYMEYHVMGFVSQVRMKPDILPCKFDFQPDRRKLVGSSLEQPYALKKQRMAIIEECLNKSVESSIASTSSVQKETSVTSPSASIMADDIDIVEHSILDDPKIKDIFPDIRSIKTEVIDQDDEENLEDYEDVDNVETEKSSLYQNRIILGSKPCSSASGTNTPEPQKEETTILVKESGLHLDGNPNYCEDCKILFPSENALDSHKSTFHSFLVRRNKAVKSTTKGSIFARKIKIEPDTIENKSITCHHCNEDFPNDITFLKHSYELLPRSFTCDLCGLEFDSDAAYKNHQITHSLNDKYLCCPICTCRYRNNDKLAGHMRMFHEFVETVVSPITSVDFNCENCDCVLPDCRRYNQHIHLKHPDLYYKTDDEERDKYKCLPSNLTFPSAYSEKIHTAALHANSVEKVSLNQQDIEECEPIPSTSADTESQSNFVPMPISTLFKCTKCQVNFLSITVVVEHFKTCEYRKGDFKCQTCRRFVQKSDIVYHLKQHELAERLKSIKVRDVNILNKIICVCKKCQVCFDEKGFQSCHAEDCKPKKNAECSLCGLIIDEDYMIHHSNAHATGVKTTDFIEVEYMSFNTIKLNPLEGQAPDMDCSARPKHLFYCPTCNCFLKINRKTHGHSDGTCNKNNVSSLCKICGLRFTSKGMDTHKREHNKYPNLKLRDMKFTNAQTGKKIDPPFPIFKKCKDCNVYFFGEVARRGHFCYSEVFKTCDYCKENFSDLAFKLHVPFHKYVEQDKKIVKKTPDIPEILITYESLQTIWNILYLCETCDTIIDTYDTVVEHCQDHFCNMESYNATINNCNICKLKFVGYSIDRHKKLHAENDINKKSFIILKFNYEKLLTKEWSSTFDSLAKEQVSQILSLSVYQFTRNIRMEIAVDGPPHLTMYKCGVCYSIVKSTSVGEHAQNNNCAQLTNRYNCMKCNLSFSGRNMKSEHDILHESRRFDINLYRIIVFNSKKDTFINDVLRSKLRPTGLHFKRCQQCGKLIKKEKFKKHYLHHIYYQNAKMKKMQLKTIVRPNIGRMVHTFYTCRRCKISVLLKNTIKIHYCNYRIKQTKCNKCSLMIRSSSMPRHVNYHERYPKMTRSDINIVYFQNKIKNNKNWASLDRTEDNELVFYQCVRCSMVVQRENNIKRHNCSSKLKRKNCNLCEMPFHSSHFAYHRRLHEQISFSKAQIVIIKFKDGVILNNVSKVDSKVSQVKSEQRVPKPNKIINQIKKMSPSRRLKHYQVNHELSDREFYRLLAYRLYKCALCKLLFITGSALVEHQKICRDDNEGVECKDCGLIFHSSMIKYHLNLQKCNFQTDINIVSLEVKGDTYYFKNVIYLCRQCNVYNISIRGIKYHLEANHKIGKKTLKCPICDISFSSVSYGMHKKNHHYKKKNTLSDLVVATVEIMSLKDALKHLPDKNEIRLINLEDLTESDNIDNERALKRKLSIHDEDEDEDEDEDSKQAKTEESCITPSPPPKPKVDVDKHGFLTCDICYLSFLHPKTLKRHMDIGRHDEERFHCSECNLMFTKISFTRHMYCHESPEDNRDYRPKYKNERKSRDNSIGVEESLQSTSRDRSKVVQESPCSSVQRVQESASRDRPRAVQESPCSSVQRVQESASRERIERSEQSEIKVELYKCSPCDVYFLRDDICRDHVTSHIPLDPTEYIACKICDLQFLCEYLGAHMRTHRDKSFNIDNLIVHEYQIQNRIEINVDTYSAADRLKSKLVSTTTHFDTEDEKNAIDSTTDTVDRLDVVSLSSNQSGRRSNFQMDVDS